MELFIVIILIIILIEASYLVGLSYNKTGRRYTAAPVFVDTSVLIDGRIVEIARAGFITSKLFIPRSVLGELQFLADNADTDKRMRARHGLDVVSELQAIDHLSIDIFRDAPRAVEGVDNQLLKLARRYNGAICTIDFNLNKVAQAEKIKVLNVNDLAMNLRMAHLPGEKLQLELTQKGNDAHQAVGHLADGTMVVVEHANSKIGSVVQVEIIRSLQTAAGKMMFARLVDGKQPRQSKQPRPSSQAGQPAPSRPQPKQPRRHPVADTPPATGAQTQPAKPQQRQPYRRRRSSPEDSLIELANR